MVLRVLHILVLAAVLSAAVSAATPEFSKAGFFELPDAGRRVFNFNPGWRFYKGAVQGAENPAFNDDQWEIVNCPHGLELHSDQASGSKNYQGEAWYRKRFHLPATAEPVRSVLHFEAVMGKTQVWLNGTRLAEHVGGYLPFEVDLTPHLKPGEENLIAVWTDNSDDPSYPPGKPQAFLDFAYFGGIYRDVWLVQTQPIHITSAVSAEEVAGGGVLVHYDNLSEHSVDVFFQTHVANRSNTRAQVSIEALLKSPSGEVVGHSQANLALSAHEQRHVKNRISVDKPQLWSPDSPALYQLDIRVKSKGRSLDGVRLKLGLRKIEFRGKEGFFLNNKPYPRKLTGANRHQDHAYVGNALPNNKSYGDALLLKNAGSAVVRAAHYPADPAFMDACDELGLFFIAATPGWHFWSDAPIFEQRVLRDVRQMVRRDRNRASVLLWEPILNETRYPAAFARRAFAAVHEEFPFDGVYTASDRHANGGQFSDVAYSHQFEGRYWIEAVRPTDEHYRQYALDYGDDKRSYFVREWGDVVDNWSAHNSPSRAARAWGEQAQIVQARHYSHMGLVNTDWETIHTMSSQHIGATQWCGFDHQRGYNNVPFYGGLTDVFRQKKYAYHLFASQQDPKIYGPKLFIAHEMTPFSGADMDVYTNCEAVRLIRYGKDRFTRRVSELGHAQPHPIVTFKNVFNFMDVKYLYGVQQGANAHFEAECVIDGKVHARHQIRTAQKGLKLSLRRLEPELPFEANGSDFITVIATIEDEHGTVRRLDNSYIQFSVKGEGELIDDGLIMANPRRLEWGSAPILVRATTTPGTITVRAAVLGEGINTPESAEILLTTSPAGTPLILAQDQPKGRRKPSGPSHDLPAPARNSDLQQKIQRLENELHLYKMREVERQQTEFIGAP